MSTETTENIETVDPGNYNVGDATFEEPYHNFVFTIIDDHPQEDEEYLLCPVCGSPYCGGCD